MRNPRYINIPRSAHVPERLARSAHQPSLYQVAQRIIQHVASRVAESIYQISKLLNSYPMAIHLRSNITLPQPVFGLRKGILYTIERNTLYRFRIGKFFEAEKYQEGVGWQATDCTDLYRIMRENDISEYISFKPFQGNLEDNESGQLCWRWAICSHEQRRNHAGYQYHRFWAAVSNSLQENCDRLYLDRSLGFNLFAHVPAALDLLDHNRNLASLLARHWEFPSVGGVNWEGVRQQLRRRRRDIMGWLGFTPSDAMVNALECRFLTWCHAEFNTAKLHRGLELLLSSDGHLIQHFSRKCIVPIDEIDEVFGAQTQRWLNLRKFRNAGTVLANFIFTINTLINIGAIDIEGAQSLASRGRMSLCTENILPFLKPHALPVGPTSCAAGVKQLNSIDQIIGEGKIMNHCVGTFSYLSTAAAGRYMIYRITSPIRATMALWKSTDLTLSLREIRGPSNRPIPVQHIREIVESFAVPIDATGWLVDKTLAA